MLRYRYTISSFAIKRYTLPEKGVFPELITLKGALHTFTPKKTIFSRPKVQSGEQPGDPGIYKIVMLEKQE